MELDIGKHLTESQRNLCADAQQFLVKTSKQLQARMISYPCSLIHDNIRLACCTALKGLIYNKKFANNPHAILNSLTNLYMEIQITSKPDFLKKVRGACQIVIDTLITSYFNEKQKWDFCLSLLTKLSQDLNTSLLALKIANVFINSMESKTINNQVIIGEILIYIKKVMESSFGQQQQFPIIDQCIQIIDNVLNIIDDDEDDQNQAENFIRNYQQGRLLLQKIIALSFQLNNSIITYNKQLDYIKSQTMMLYKRIWMFSCNQTMFRLCLETLISTHHDLIDEQVQIMESVIKMLQRSIGSNDYHLHFHRNIQNITISLLYLLRPQQSYLQMVKNDPDYFIQLNEDFTMEQNQHILQSHVGSLVSSLCLYIDGYLTFFGSMCIMILKCWKNPFVEIDNQDTEYLQNLEQLWNGQFTQKLGTSIFILSALSDQIEKRQDLYQSLMLYLIKLNPAFKIQQCILHPYIICRFMTLYAFYSFRGCLNIFIPYKRSMPVYEVQLQSSYKIMQRYSNRRQGVPEYLMEIAPVVILSDSLTPSLQNAIFNSPQLLPNIQFPILQKLSLWMYQSYEKQNTIVCNKVSNLIVHLLDNFKVSQNIQEATSQQSSVYQYLESLYRILIKREGHPLQQSIIQIIKGHIQKFSKIISNYTIITNQERVIYFLEIGYIVTVRNQFTMNSCLQLFIQLLKILPYQQVYQMIQKSGQWLLKVQRQEDIWECFFLLQFCILKIGQFKQILPSLNLSLIIPKIQTLHSKFLITQAYMFLYSLVTVDPVNQTQLESYLSNKSLPCQICPLQSKQFCIYLLNLLKFVQYLPQNILSILETFLSHLKIHEKVEKQTKAYQQKIYEFSFEPDNVAINSFEKLKVLVHPFNSMKIDVYVEFRNFWRQYRYREAIMNNSNNQIRSQIQDTLSKATVNFTARKIYRVKKSLNL